MTFLAIIAAILLALFGWGKLVTWATKEDIKRSLK